MNHMRAFKVAGHNKKGNLEGLTIFDKDIESVKKFLEKKKFRPYSIREMPKF